MKKSDLVISIPDAATRIGRTETRVRQLIQKLGIVVVKGITRQDFERIKATRRVRGPAAKKKT